MVIFGLGALICILSAVRIHSIATLDYLDFSHSVVADGVYSVLEPYLGTINACLPLLQPIVNKFTTTRIWTSLRGTSRGAVTRESNSDHLATIGSDVKNGRFRHLDEESTASKDDQYPLTTVTGLEQVNNAKVYAAANNISEGPNDAIGITRDWNVKSLPSKSRK